MKEHNDHYEVNIDLPGFKKNEISLELKEGYLVIVLTLQRGLTKTERIKKQVNLSAGSVMQAA